MSIAYKTNMENKTIFIFGGSGSLGNALIRRYLENNTVVVYSRDENKHWKMSLDYQNPPNLQFIIGDIRDQDKICQSLIRVNPHYIIIAAALKHIDRCEFESNESINTNLLGTQKILNVIESNKHYLSRLETTCFISTDKACSPVNIYGMCKALSESLVVEKAKYIKDMKFVAVRYGNVLNSRGSIIPILHNIGKSEKFENYKLTDERMTRFVMTLDESVDLIQYAILKGDSGDIVIPKLRAMLIKDLINIFSKMYEKSVIISGLRPGEKIAEALINETQSCRVTKGDRNYLHIKPSYNLPEDGQKEMTEMQRYDSNSGLMTEDELRVYLDELKLL